ncbi:MAG: MBL fold metallo-hydrolase [Alphaproteobacteria bacterium]|nr:MBL fold metallo-hydrolase [Alphaproteobacteria bacterium]
MQKLRNNKFELIQMPPQNTQSLIVSSGRDCLVFDPWGRADDWDSVLQERGLKLRAIYLTHGHPDHIAAAPELAKRHNVSWYLHNADFRLVGWGNDLLEYFGLPPITINDVRPTELALERTEVLPNMFMEVIETPGHTPGGVAYHFPDEKILVIGDTLFQESIGRYDLPGGDKHMLFKSISNIYTMDLPADTEIIHGHGMATDISWLKANNPYFRK